MYILQSFFSDIRSIFGFVSTDTSERVRLAYLSASNPLPERKPWMWTKKRRVRRAGREEDTPSHY